MKNLFKYLIRTIVIVILSGILLAGGLFVAVYFGVFGPFPSEEELSSIQNEEASLVYSSDGRLIGKYFAENRTNINWGEIPEHLVNALVATEDKRFFEHDGYDGRSYLRVFVKTIILGNRNSGGGSTLTQQLVKNLYGRNNHSFLSMPVNKLKEAIIASRIEDVLTKQQILLLYFNSVPFGEQVYGIEAASLRYFDKHCRELNVQESAVLVGILKANTYYNPRVNPENAKRRRNQVLTLMFSQQYISKTEFDSLKALPIKLSYSNYQREAPAGYFVYQVKKKLSQILENLSSVGGEVYDYKKDGLRVYTTLNMSIQNSAKKSVRKQLMKMQPLLEKELKRTGKKKKWLKEQSKKYSSEKLSEIKPRSVFSWSEKSNKSMSLADSLWNYYSMLNAAVLVAEPGTGRVLTWVGGNNYRYLPYDMVFSKRQIASAIKPLVYAAGLENGLVPCDYLSNEFVEYEEFNDWAPRNYDNSSSKDTLIALWYSLANSMNLPTMDLYFKTGHDEVADMLRRFDLDAPINETPAIALGALDISLYEIVKAYGALAYDGQIATDLILIDKVTDAKGNIIYSKGEQEFTKVIKRKIEDQITFILEKAINEGTGKSIRNRFGVKAELAGKTGTAQNYSNAWFMCYTKDIVIGTWVGARSPKVHFNGGIGSGSALALPISGQILSDIEAKNSLKNKYLTNFDHQYRDGQLIHCDPFYYQGNTDDSDDENGEFNEEDLEVDPKEKTKKKKKSGIRKFFDKIFKGKKK